MTHVRIFAGALMVVAVLIIGIGVATDASAPRPPFGLVKGGR